MLLLVSAVQANSVSEIQLQHRTAEEIIPIIEPMLGPNDAITGVGFKIFLQSSPDTLARVRSMVDVLDIPAKILQISVAQGSQRDLAALGIDASVQVEKGVASVEIGNERDNDDAAGGNVTFSTSGGSASVDGISTQKSLRDNPVHQVRVTEGTEAYIETGERIPYFYGVAWGGRRALAGNVEYQDAVTGFYVLARARGDNVVLEVSPYKSARSSTGDGNIETQSASTTVTGRFGEWLLIGGATEQVKRNESATGTTYATEGGNSTGIWIRADLVE